MTPYQRKLLCALRAAGGCWDRNMRIVAEGEAHNSTTALSCFRKGWIASDGQRVTLTAAGAAAFREEVAAL